MSTKKIFTNTLAQIGAKVMTALISIYMIKILTEYLDIEGYGMYSKIYNYLSIFSVIADLGLYTITVREISENLDDEKKVEKIASNVLTLRTGMGIIIILLAVGIGFFLPGYNSHVALLGIGMTGFFTLFGLMNSSVMSLLQAHLRTEFSFISTVTGKITTFLTIFLFAFFLFPKDVITSDTALLLVFFAGLLGNLVMTLLTFWYSRRITPLHFAWDSEYIRHILRISLPYGVALFLNVIFFKVDVILISILESQELADHSIALYSVPMKIVEVGMMYGTVFLNSLLPVLTLAIREKNEPKIKNLTQKSAEMLLFFGIGITSFLMLFAPEVIHMIASAEYTIPLNGASSIDVLRVVAPIFLVYFLSSLFTYILIAEGRQKSMMWINSIIAVVNIVGNILVIPQHGFMGSAYVTVLSQTLLLMLTWFITRENIHLGKVFPFLIVLLVLITIAFGLTSFLLPFFSGIFSRLLIGLGIFGVIYAGGAGVWWWRRKIG